MKTTSLLGQISSDLLIPVGRLERVINSAPRRYKVYSIPKRSGRGKRIIAQPSKEVKALQYWVMRNILYKFDVHPSAKAYIEGSGILNNALPHAAGKYLIKLDFKDFFYSIKARDFISYISGSDRVSYSDSDLQKLIYILFYDKGMGDHCLSIGAPSSPLLSNIIMYSFDEELYEYCVGKGIVYTRYSDDLSLSTSNPALRSDVLIRIRRLLVESPYPKLQINEDKTIYASRANKRIVTGLVVTNDGEISIGRAKKRLIRAQIYKYLQGLLDDDEVKYLKGMVAYVNSVEPSFVIRMKNKYGPLTIFQGEGRQGEGRK